MSLLIIHTSIFKYTSTVLTWLLLINEKYMWFIKKKLNEKYMCLDQYACLYIASSIIVFTKYNMIKLN